MIILTGCKYYQVTPSLHHPISNGDFNGYDDYDDYGEFHHE